MRTKALSGGSGIFSIHKANPKPKLTGIKMLNAMKQVRESRLKVMPWTMYDLLDRMQEYSTIGKPTILSNLIGR
jgi:hypothetical protein